VLATLRYQKSSGSSQSFFIGALRREGVHPAHQKERAGGSMFPTADVPKRSDSEAV